MLISLVRFSCHKTSFDLPPRNVIKYIPSTETRKKKRDEFTCWPFTYLSPIYCRSAPLRVSCLSLSVSSLSPCVYSLSHCVFCPSPIGPIRSPLCYVSWLYLCVSNVSHHVSCLSLSVSRISPFAHSFLHHIFFLSLCISCQSLFVPSLLHFVSCLSESPICPVFSYPLSH